MTSKPFIYVFNTDDAGLADTAMQDELRALVAPADAIFLDAKFESELVELEPDEAARDARRQRPGRGRASTSWPASASTRSACRRT